MKEIEIRAKCIQISKYKEVHKDMVWESFESIPQYNIFNRFLLSVQIIAAQEEMLRKERELEEARKKLAQIRQQQYKFLPSELREDAN